MPKRSPVQLPGELDDRPDHFNRNRPHARWECIEDTVKQQILIVRSVKAERFWETERWLISRTLLPLLVTSGFILSPVISSALGCYYQHWHLPSPRQSGMGEVANFLIALLQRSIGVDDNSQLAWLSSSALNECVRLVKSFGRQISWKRWHVRLSACIFGKTSFKLDSTSKTSSLDAKVFKFDKKKEGK